MLSVARYVIAIKRELWDKTQLAEVLGRLKAIPDHRVVGGTTGRRTIIEASAPAAEQIQQELKGVCYIEPEIHHVAQEYFRD
jgi:hypothetical protein